MIIEKFGLYFVIFVSYQVKIIQVQFFTAVSGIRRGMGNLTELNRRITDLKMAGSTNTTAEIRRDSNSTVSTYYGSMKSADLYSSRRSSQVSQVRLSYTLRTLICWSATCSRTEAFFRVHQYCSQYWKYLYLLTKLIFWLLYKRCDDEERIGRPPVITKDLLDKECCLWIFALG